METDFMVRRPKTSLPIILSVCLFVLGCQYDPYAHLLTTVRPDARDVVGRYLLSKEMLYKSDIADLHGRTCSLELRGDGSFTATNIPPFTMGEPGANFFDTLLSGSGRWRIAETGVVDNGWWTTKVWGIGLDSDEVKLATPDLTGSKKSYGLIFTLGDPDTGEALIFKRS